MLRLPHRAWISHLDLAQPRSCYRNNISAQLNRLQSERHRLADFDKMANDQETVIGVKTTLQPHVSVESSVSIDTILGADFHENTFASLFGLRVLWTTSSRSSISNATALTIPSLIDSELAVPDRNLKLVVVSTANHLITGIWNVPFSDGPLPVGTVEAESSEFGNVTYNSSEVPLP